MIPSLPNRESMRNTAIDSVISQNYPNVNVLVEIDHERRGAYHARNEGMMKVQTEWTGFLDDDDILLPHHVGTLLRLADKHQADLVWGWFEVQGGTDPFPQHRGKQITNYEHFHIFPITVLCRTEMLHSAYEHMGGFQYEPDAVGSWEFQDKPVWRDIMARQGGKPHATDEITWVWRHHGGNTSGLGSYELRLRANRSQSERAEAARIGINRRNI